MPSVIKRINEYNRLLPASLKALKWAALKESPFRFFRGTCHLFAADFARIYGFNNEVRTWICGDLHFENFGSYKGENRLVYFDINDFDESILLTPEPEVTRFLSSVIIAGQQMNAPEKEIYATLKEIVNTYANTLLRGKALMMERDLASGVLKKYFEQVAQRDRQTFIKKKIVKVDGAYVLKQDKAHFLPVADKKKQEIYKGIKPLLEQNRHFAGFTLLDAAFRIAGTGSMGLERYCVLCHDKHNGKYYLLDVKEARASCYSYVSHTLQPKFKNDANRIIYAEYTMQFNSANFLSSARIGGKWFVVKELQPVIDKMTIEDFKNDFILFREAALMMAPLVAYDQLRSSGFGGASPADDLMRFAHKQKWQTTVVDAAADMAENNLAYYNKFLKGG
jgi:uncharacterized protein (DUF2252 family)